MSQIILTCPHCNMRLGTQVAPVPGSILTCPTCLNNFAAPDLTPSRAPLAAPQSYNPAGYGSYSPGAGSNYYGKPAAKPAGDNRKLFAGLVIAAAILVVGGGVLGVALIVGMAVVFSGNGNQVAAQKASTNPTANSAAAGSGATTTGNAPQTESGSGAYTPFTPVSAQPASGGVSIAGLPLSHADSAMRYDWKPKLHYSYSFRLTTDAGQAATKYYGGLNYSLNEATAERVSRMIEKEEGAERSREGTGSAFVVHQDGLLVTCAHVVRGASKMSVSLGGKEYAGDVVGIDDRHDLALIRIAATNLPAVPLADSEKVQLAETVRAVGFPLSTVLGDSVKITTGSISGFVAQKGDKLLQVDASINPGNSGGPLVNDRGEVVGVNSAVMVGEAISDVGFAVPSNYVLQLLRDKGVVPTAASAGRVLDGPTLARAIVPGVAFVKVDLGGGGRSLQALDFFGSCHRDSSSQLPPSVMPGLGSSKNDSGQMVMSSSGEILACPSKVDLPFLMMPLAQAAIEKLPTGGEREWESRRVRALTLVAPSQSQQGPAGLGSYGRIDPRRSRYFGSTPTETRTVIVIPAIEQVKYRITGESAETIDIEKTIDLSTVDRESQGGQLQITGTGKLVWDKKLGLPRSLKQSMTMAVSSSSGRVTAPLEFDLTFQNAKSAADLALDMEKLKAEGKAAAEARIKQVENKLSNAIEALKSPDMSYGRLSQPLRDLQAAKVDPARREEVSALLEPILAAGREAFPSITDKMVPEAALRVAKVWGTPKNVPSILKHLEVESATERWAALEALEELGRGPEVVAAVIKRLFEPQDCSAAGRALKKMGPEAEDPVYKCLSDKDPRVKHEALQVLAEVGTEKSLARLKKVPEIKDTLLKMYFDTAVRGMERRVGKSDPQVAKAPTNEKSEDPFGDLASTPKSAVQGNTDLAKTATPKVARGSTPPDTVSKNSDFGDLANPKGVVGSTAGNPKVVKLKSKGGDGKPGEVRRFGPLGWGIKSLAFAPNGVMLAAGKPDRTLLLFDVNEERRLDFAEKLEILQSVELCRFTPDGTRLVAGGYSGIMQIWDVSPEGSLKPAGQFAGHSKEVNCLSFSADGKLALSGGEEKRVRYWNVETGRELGAIGGFEGKVKACILSHDGKAAYATDGATMFAINLEKQEIVKRSRLTNSWASGQFACYSPDYKYVAVGDTYNVRIWEIQTGKELRPLEEQEIQWAGEFTPDGTRLITGGNGKVNVWDVKKSSRLAALATEPNAYVQCLAASPDNQHVAATSGPLGQNLVVLRIPGVDD